MCRLIVGNKNEKANIKHIKNIILAQSDELKGEKNGIAAIILGADNQLKVWRELDTKKYDFVIQSFIDSLDDAKFFSIHTRTATSGEKNLANVHFFEVGKCLIAHNGWIKNSAIPTTFYRGGRNLLLQSFVNDKNYDTFIMTLQNCRNCNYIQSKYCNKHKELGKAVDNYVGSDNYDNSGLMCDTHEFLTRLPKPLALQGIKDLIIKMEFYGAAVLFDRTTSKAFLIVEKLVNAFTDFKTYAIEFSYDPKRKYCLNKTNTFSGIPFQIEEPEEELEDVEYTVPYGTYEIKIGMPNA